MVILIEFFEHVWYTENIPKEGADENALYDYWKKCECDSGASGRH